MKRFALYLLCACLAFVAAVPARAGNGHLLHGVGAVNSSMGGVACALPVEVIGAIHVNPAVLAKLPGYEVGFSAEVFADQPKATATFVNTPGRPNGSFTTEGDTEPGVIPAIAVSYRPEGRPWALGFGLLGVAGFRTDWPQDPNNPIFDPQPAGFGAVKTNLAITKIPFALAWEVNPRLALGAALVVYQGGLAISPLPPATPDCTRATPGSGRTQDCFYADADNVVHTYALAAQLGLYWELDDAWSLGLAYTSPQDFADYEWNSQVALPYLIDAQGNQTFNPNFGVGKKVRYALDGPQIVSVGVGWQPRDGLKVGFDGRWVDYTSVDGAGGVGGFKPDASLNEIGWDDILVGAIGVEWRSSPSVTLRAGFNYSQTPIREEVVFTSLGTPPTFKDHYTVGFGYQATEKLQLNLGAYWAPEREVSGPLLSPFLAPNPTLEQQQVPGGTFTISEQIVSGLVALSYRF